MTSSQPTPPLLRRRPRTAAERAVLRAWSRSVARERAERALQRDIAALLRALHEQEGPA